ncbi:protein RGF1 INDUCIBLE TRANSCRIPTION FACTOR 1 [Ricinus communis]|uniref:protein RGF1 INDUCIBLE TRANSCRIPTION FACTOR 1 n=1 Tax=Ricinus communis TaxID=3988 RepID=UPI00201A7848|nr:protein RGF1 INDUCIBLE TRANSCRIPTION FACTOR 1 [Ricinus communis]
MGKASIKRFDESKNQVKIKEKRKLYLSFSYYFYATSLIHKGVFIVQMIEVVPKWVIVMFNTMFFRTCKAHPGAKKNGLDRFCVDCHCSLCSICLPDHAQHKHIKIRRYIYSDVVNRQDLCKLFNCSGIQTYIANKAKVLFLKQRNQNYQHQQQQQSHPKDYSCIVCDRSLHDSNSLYCSIACKVSDIYGNYSKKDEEFLSLLKKRKLKQSRKGVPLRAPMF